MAETSARRCGCPYCAPRHDWATVYVGLCPIWECRQCGIRYEEGADHDPPATFLAHLLAQRHLPLSGCRAPQGGQ